MCTPLLPELRKVTLMIWSLLCFNGGRRSIRIAPKRKWLAYPG